MTGRPFSELLAEARALAEQVSLLGDPSVLEVLREARRAARTPQEKAEVLLLEARWLLRSGRDAEAQTVLDMAQGLVPGHPELMADVCALRARVLSKRGKLLAANEYAHQALRLNPAHVEARLVLGEVAFRLNDPARAVAVYGEVLPLLPPDERPGAHLTLAEGYRRMGLPALARLHARLALKGALPPSQRWKAIFLRLTSVHRATIATATLALFMWGLSAALGRVSWGVAAFVMVGVVVLVPAVAWLTTPAFTRSAHQQRNSKQSARIPPS